jgi:hypothetical protein
MDDPGLHLVKEEVREGVGGDEGLALLGPGRGGITLHI